LIIVALALAENHFLWVLLATYRLVVHPTIVRGSDQKFLTLVGSGQYFVAWVGSCQTGLSSKPLIYCGSKVYSGWVRAHLYPTILWSSTISHDFVWKKDFSVSVRDGPWPYLIRGYFWSMVNKRPPRLWPVYFLTRPKEIFFLIRREGNWKFGIFRGNFPNSEVADPTPATWKWPWTGLSQKFWPSQVGVFFLKKIIFTMVLSMVFIFYLMQKKAWKNLE